ncbi:MAG: peptidyl-prolyl cis-trans isomerase [SAR324 cluster bacterium]|nr:peptidyl-prolyl cis-trans isomerase [SAR324 cluster bacterium]
MKKTYIKTAKQLIEHRSTFCLCIIMLTLIFSGCDDNNVEKIENLGKTIAEIDGYTITDREVDLILFKKSEMTDSPVARKEALEKIIDEALFYQKGIELGLDKNEQYRNEITKKILEIKAFKRQRMRSYVIRNQIAQISVTEEDVRAYFNANQQKLQSEYHLAKLRFANTRQARAFLSELEKGVSFTELANRVTGNQKNNGVPSWDQGFLRWINLNQAYFGAVADLKVGEVSQPVTRKGFSSVYLFKLLDKKTNPDISFDSVKNLINGRLKMKKMQDINENYPKTLRDNAKIVYNP